jgi:PAS domain S-box-containing protein
LNNLVRNLETKGPVVRHCDNEVIGDSTTTIDIEVAVLDASGLIVAINGPWSDFCEANGGNPALTGVGVNYLEVCQKAGNDPGATEVADAIRASLAGDVPSAHRVQIACHSPLEQRWFDVFVSTRTNGEGITIGATVMLTKILEPHSGVPDKNHTLAQEMLEACPDALLMADQHGIIESTNGPAERLFGYDRSALLGQPIDRLLPGRLTEQPSGSMQLRAVRSDRSEIPVEVGLSLQLVGGETRLIAAVRNITERLRAEERHNRIDRCIDGASDAILVFDESSFKLVHANSGAAEMFGYSRSEMVGSMSPTDFAPELGVCAIAGSLGTLRDAPDQHVRIVTTGLDRAGSEFPIEVQINWPAPTTPNAARLVVAVIRDQTDRHLG